MLLHLPVLTRVRPSPLPADSSASLSALPQPLSMPGSPQGSFLSPILAPEAAREALGAELMLQHLGREQSVLLHGNAGFVYSFCPSGSKEMQNNQSQLLITL